MFEHAKNRDMRLQLKDFGLPLLVVAATQTAGCATRMEGATAQQAAYDFKCASEQVKVEKVAFGEYRAEGCGKSASYQLVGECYFAWNPCRAARLTPPEAQAPHP